jgi:hypothetical protein
MKWFKTKLKKNIYGHYKRISFIHQFMDKFIGRISKDNFQCRLWL